MVKKLIDERRLNGEPDFQPTPNGSPPPPLNHNLPSEILSHLQNGIDIPNMMGEMVNFNYPDDFETMFNLDTEISISGDLSGEYLQFSQFSINIFYF